MRMSSKKLASLVLAALAIVPLGVAAQQKVDIPGRDKLLPEKPAQIYSIGAEDGEEWELLSGVRQVAFDARDNLYVLDGNNYRVLVFDANGRFLRKISKQGGGPGELLGPIGMTVTTDGLIVVADIGRRAYSIFKLDGTFVKNVQFDDGEVPGMGGAGGGLQAHPRSGVVARTSPFMGMTRGGPNVSNIGAPTGERKSYVKWWDFAGGASTTDGGARAPADAVKTAQLYEFTLPSITPRVVENSGSGGERRVAVMITQPMWQMEVYQGVLPTGGIAFVNEKDYRVKMTTPAGQIERVVERPFAAKKATEKDKELALEQRRENMKNNTGARINVSNVNGRQSFSTGAGGGGRGEIPSIEEMLKTATFEDFIPVLRGLRTDPQGRIWLARTPADFGPNGPVDIIRSDGTYIGTIAKSPLPDAVARSGRAAYVERDDLGVEHVVVRRLPPTWS